METFQRIMPHSLGVCGSKSWNSMQELNSQRTNPGRLRCHRNKLYNLCIHLYKQRPFVTVLCFHALFASKPPSYRLSPSENLPHCNRCTDALRVLYGWVRFVVIQSGHVYMYWYHPYPSSRVHAVCIKVAPLSLSFPNPAIFLSIRPSLHLQWQSFI